MYPKKSPLCKGGHWPEEVPFSVWVQEEKGKARFLMADAAKDLLGKRGQGGEGQRPAKREVKKPGDTFVLLDNTF
jgi:hypothetical protein